MSTRLKDLIQHPCYTWAVVRDEQSCIDCADLFQSSQSVSKVVDLQPHMFPALPACLDLHRGA